MYQDIKCVWNSAPKSTCWIFFTPCVLIHQISSTHNSHILLLWEEILYFLYSFLHHIIASPIRVRVYIYFSPQRLTSLSIIKKGLCQFVVLFNSSLWYFWKSTTNWNYGKKYHNLGLKKYHKLELPFLIEPKSALFRI